MRNAPSVSMTVGRSSCGAAVALAAWLVAAATLAGWTAVAPRPGAQALAVAVLLLAGWAAWRDWRDWRGPSPSVLAWDGQAWRLDDAPHQVEVVLDLQGLLLLRLAPTGVRGPVRWPWLVKELDTTAWQAVRRALYSRGTSPSRPGGQAAPT